MEKEKAKNIVNLISMIAQGEATIALNVSYENATNADHNRKLVESWKQKLVEQLSHG